MKKLALSLMAFVVCACTLFTPVLATEFVPSVTTGGAPDIVTSVVDGQEIAGQILDQGGNPVENILPGCIYSYDLQDALDENSTISEATKKMMNDLFNQFKNGQIKLSDVLPALNDLVANEFGEGNNADNLVVRDLFLANLIHDDCIQALKVVGNKAQLTFKTNIPKDTFLKVAYLVDGKWELAEDVVINEDGTVTALFEDLCPIIFLVPGEMNEAPKPFNWLPIVIGMAIVCAGYVYSKKKKA